jgi:hypothetical protein
MKALFAMLALSLFASGCLLIPVPTPGHTVGSSVTSETLDTLLPGEVSRTDVLLAIGEPTARAQNDRYLVYGWIVVHGYGVLFVGAGYTGAILPPMPVAAPNWLCMEFGPDAMLTRRLNLRGSLNENPSNALSACQKALEGEK